MSDTKVIPILPCIDLKETLTFYGALGFEVTHEQVEPYVYGAVQHGSTELHFYGGFKKSERSAGHSCLVMTTNLTAVHERFIAGLRAVYGRPPTAGAPRITRLRSGQSRFGVIDPAGNTLIYIAPDEGEVAYYEAPDGERSHLAWALDTAIWLRDLKGFDDVAAARVLDKALARNEPAPALDRARVLAARAELAVALGDSQQARAFEADLAQIALSTKDISQYQEELEASQALERLLNA